MKPSSAKNKGRRLALEIVASILARYPFLQPDDVQPTSSGAPGEDVKLSPAARAVLPFAMECKNVEKLNFREAYRQACKHAEKRPGAIPVLISRSNRTEPLVTLRWEHLLDLLERGSAARTIEARRDAPRDKQNQAEQCERGGVRAMGERESENRL